MTSAILSMRRTLLFLWAFLLLSGCVTHIPLAEQVPPVNYPSAGPVVISVVDDRRRVKQGKRSTFIGVAHGAFGIPVDLDSNRVLAVESGDKERDLAQFLQFRVARGLADKGWRVVEATLPKAPSNEEAQELLRNRGAAALVLLKLNEWYVSLNLNLVTAFNFDTDTDIFIHRDGREAPFHKTFSSRDVIKVRGNDSYQNQILAAYRDKLAEILNDAEVKRELEAQ